jgi:predicted ATP-dependent serine protease
VIPTFVPTGIAGFDKLLGGGLVVGSVTLLYGEQGVGKTMLAEQITDHVGPKTPIQVIDGFCGGRAEIDSLADRARKQNIALLLITNTEPPTKMVHMTNVVVKMRRTARGIELRCDKNRYARPDSITLKKSDGRFA